MSNYLTVAELADAAGVSKQAIYKRLAGDLAPYCKTDRGRKIIDPAALDLFNPVEQPLNNRDNLDSTAEQLREKEEQITRQREEIQDLKKQIAELQAHVLEQSRTLAEALTNQTAALSDMLEKQSRLQENFQVLLGQHQKMLEGLAAPPKEDPAPAPVDSTVEQPGDNQDSTVEQPIESQKEKKAGFFSRLFGRG